MRAVAFLLSSAFLVTTLALPQPVAEPQDIDFDAVETATAIIPTGAPLADSAIDAIPTYDAEAAASAAAVDAVTTLISEDLAKRQPLATTTSAAPSCTAQPKGSGPISSPDTAPAFQSNPIYAQTAEGASVPDGYSLVFAGLTGATSAPTYLGYYTFTTYNPILCQQKCDATVSCYAFNLYMERDPSVDPGVSCPNPSSTTNIKCSLWGTQIDNTTATNKGQWRQQFEVLIAASNGYNSLASPPPQTNFTGPTKFGGAINSPDNSYIEMRYYPGPYNPAQCTAACQATTQYDRAHPAKDGSYATCAFVNTYVLSKNGVPQGTYCSMYTKVWGRGYDTNYGQYRGSDYYSVSQSYGYTYSVGS